MSIERSNSVRAAFNVGGQSRRARIVRRLSAMVVSGTLVLLATSPAAAGTGSSARFLMQQGRSTPLAHSSTFVLAGTATGTGCRYRPPEIRVSSSGPRWEVRAIGVDQGHCLLLMEAGVPSADAPAPSGGTSRARIGPPATGLLAATSVASGYASAWFEDLAHLHVTEDRTYIAWQYTGSCVSSGSASGQWSWDALFSLVSKGGTTSYNGCRYFLGDTWSSMKSGLCPYTTVWTYYYHVRTYGWSDGSVSGNYDDFLVDNNCLPLFPHFSGGVKTG